MARICRKCNRPKDADHHDIVQVPAIDPETLKWKFENDEIVWEDAPKGMPNRYACRVRLVATSPVTGKTLTPQSPQRITELDTRYVHVSRFEGDLRP